MAWTQEQLDALDAAIASGTLAVRFADGRMVTYQSIDAMLKARAVMASGIASVAGRSMVRTSITTFDRGGR